MSPSVLIRWIRCRGLCTKIARPQVRGGCVSVCRAHEEKQKTCTYQIKCVVMSVQKQMCVARGICKLIACHVMYSMCMCLGIYIDVNMLAVSRADVNRCFTCFVFVFFVIRQPWMLLAMFEHI